MLLQLALETVAVTARSVSSGQLAVRTEGASGALLKGLCTLAGRSAFVRALYARGIAPAVTETDPAITHEDFEHLTVWKHLELVLGSGKTPRAERAARIHRS